MTDTKPKTSATIDLDALRIARGEAEGNDAPTIRVAGKVWNLPHTLPADFLFRLGAVFNGELVEMKPLLQLIFGDDFDEIIAELSVPDINELMRVLPTAYGGEVLGESPGSRN